MDETTSTDTKRLDMVRASMGERAGIKKAYFRQYRITKNVKKAALLAILLDT